MQVHDEVCGKTIERTSTAGYALKWRVHLPFEETERRVRNGLQDKGFRVLAEIDVQKTLRDNLDVDFRPYRILGTCPPPLAHQALLDESNIGLLLPCNVIVYAGEDSETTEVAVTNPVLHAARARREGLLLVANEVNRLLQRALVAVQCDLRSDGPCWRLALRRREGQLTYPSSSTSLRTDSRFSGESQSDAPETIRSA